MSPSLTVNEAICPPIAGDIFALLQASIVPALVLETVFSTVLISGLIALTLIGFSPPPEKEKMIINTTIMPAIIFLFFVIEIKIHLLI